jgi:phosphate transport system substrate-binding protein
MPAQWSLIVLLVAVSAVPSAFAQILTGAGATFPYPIYSVWFDAYQKSHPGVRVTYRPVGSGQGIADVVSGAVDFGASDGPMTDAQLAEARTRLGSEVLHLPTVLGAAVPAYNLPGIRAQINFTPEALSGIFLGTITRWNDPELVRANRGTALPPNPITVVHRADKSGTTYCWTDYLSKVSAVWNSKFGRGTSVKWPVGLEAQKNEGVAALIKETPYSLGYVELTYAVQNQIAYGTVRNAAGEFVKAGIGSVAAAAKASAASIPADFRVSITNASGRGAYPIATFTWLLVPASGPRPANRKALAALLNWMLGAGQRMAPSLGYVPLPVELVERERRTIASLR